MNLDGKRHYEGLPYGPVGTILLSLAAFTMSFIGHSLGKRLFALFKYGGDEGTQNLMNGDALAGTVICSALLTVPALILFAALRKNISIKNYLGFRLPGLRQVLLFMMGSAILIGFSDLSSHLMDKPIAHPFAEYALKTSHYPSLLFIAIVMAAPLVEELLFRGFLFEGFPKTQAGQIFAIVLTSLLWTTTHGQYELFYLVHIFIQGLYLGFVKMKTNSTSLTILLHSLTNGFVMGQAYLHISGQG